MNPFVTPNRLLYFDLKKNRVLYNESLALRCDTFGPELSKSGCFMHTHTHTHVYASQICLMILKRFTLHIDHVTKICLIFQLSKQRGGKWQSASSWEITQLPSYPVTLYSVTQLPSCPVTQTTAVVLSRCLEFRGSWNVLSITASWTLGLTLNRTGLQEN